MSHLDSERAQLLGSLIKEARLQARRSVEECAQVLGITPERYVQAEAGEHTVSLPDLEALALFLKVPMGYFWGSDQLPADKEPDFDSFLTLRHRLISVLLRQARLRARLSPEEVAEASDIDAEQLATYETGEAPIPYLHLEQICKALKLSMNYFVDDERGPLGRHESEQSLLREFHRMSPEMQAFISKPANVRYLETAKRLSEMDVEKLRQIAEGILDITF